MPETRPGKAKVSEGLSDRLQRSILRVSKYWNNLQLGLRMDAKLQWVVSRKEEWLPKGKTLKAHAADRHHQITALFSADERGDYVRE